MHTSQKFAHLMDSVPCNQSLATAGPPSIIMPSSSHAFWSLHCALSLCNNSIAKARLVLVHYLYYSTRFNRLRLTHLSPTTFPQLSLPPNPPAPPLFFFGCLFFVSVNFSLVSPLCRPSWSVCPSFLLRPH